jgi:methyl-accepting chemotaxis protein
MKLSIRVKLLGTIGFNLLLMALLGTFILVQMSSMNQRAAFLGESTIPSLKEAAESRRIINRYRALQNGYVAFEGIADRQRIRNEMADLETAMDLFFMHYETMIGDDTEQRAFAQMQQLWPLFVRLTRNELMPAVDRGDNRTAQQLLSSSLADFEQLYAIGNDLSASNDQQGLDAVQAAENTYINASRLTIGLLIGALLLVATVGTWLALNITRNLSTLQQATAAVSAGNLDETVALRSSDEIGDLAASFNQMTSNLRRARDLEAENRAADERRNAQERQMRTELQAAVNVYSQFISKVASGDLTARVTPQGDAELRRIGDDLNAMVEGLHSITSEVQQANANISAAAAEILAATTQQAASAAEQSAAITQTSTTIEEVKAIALQTAQQAAQVAHDSQVALTAARQGTNSVEETVNGMGQIRTRVETIAQTILGLAEQTQAIGGIITTVSELADQSNLLALNAAIEAARAGEQGKSFAVVAQHVRELAERSKAATQQVREILSEIQKATNAAVLVTEEGTKGVESGAQLAGQAGQAIHRIANEVEGGAQANVQIAAAAQQQTAGMEQIGQAMGSIQQATTQTLASTRQAERAAQDLHTLAKSLQQTITTYKL